MNLLEVPFYFDMDGVLADFDGFASKLLYKHEVYNHSSVTRIIKHHALNGLYTSLPDLEIELAKQLMMTLKDRGHRLEVLSSTTDSEHKHVIADDKTEWLNTRGIDKYIEKYNFVNLSDKKADYAPGILLDDWWGAGIPFRNAGGLWIKHTNMSDTINHLHNLFPTYNLLELIR